MAFNQQALKGGKLADVMLEVMIPERNKAKFNELARPSDKKVLAAWKKALGWSPPDEIAEWAGARPGYGKLFDSISDVWMIECDPTWIERAPTLLKKVGFLNSFEVATTLMTGLEIFARDPSGDSSFVSTLPGAGATASVHVYNHENGELEGPHFSSIASFFARYFTPHEDEDEDEDEGGDKYHKVVQAFEKDAKKRRDKRAAWEDPVQLFNRARWLFESLGGKLPYAFAQKLTGAPTFSQWQKERPQVAKCAWLACYWPLAHLVLGSAGAYREALALARRAPGATTAAFLDQVEGAAAGKGFGKLPAKKFAELQDAARKNCPPELLEPAARDVVNTERAAGVARLSEAEEKRRLGAGESPWALMRAFPDDVEAHDRLLKQLCAKDKQLKEVVERYLKQRTADAWNGWPSSYSKLRPPKELSVAVAAAFRAGLKFDEDHPKSNAGITQTLLAFDDDHAVAAWEAAIDKVDLADDRLKYVLLNLRDSKHPRAPELLLRAAMRFFDQRDKAQERRKAREKEGPTLENMFEVDSHLLSAVVHILRTGGAGAEQVVNRALSRTSGMSILGTALGLAFRIVGARGIKEHAPFLFEYLRAADQKLGSDFVGDETQFNIAEASAALPGLVASETRTEVQKLLRQTFDRGRASAEAALDLRAALVPGLLLLQPHDAELIAFTERVLGNRTGAMRVYGALRAVELVKLEQAAPWVRPHLYLKRTSLSKDQTGDEVMQAQARAALKAIGKDAPRWDHADEYAIRVAKADLPKALVEPHRYHRSNVFERIRKERLVHPDVVKIGGEVLEEAFRYSADDPDRSNCRWRSEGLRAMVLQGAASVPLWARYLALPHVKRSERATFLLCLRVVTGEPEVRRWLQSASREDVLRQLHDPEPRFMAWLDLLAAHAAVCWGAEAEPAIRAALGWRLERALCGGGYGGWNEQEPTLFFLPRVLASLSAEGRREVQRLAASLDDGEYVVKTALAEAAKSFSTVPRMTFDGALKLQTRLREGYDHRLELSLSVSGAKVRWETAFDELYFDHVVEERALKASDEVKCASAEAAKALAERLAQQALRMGYRPAKAKAKKKR